MGCMGYIEVHGFGVVSAFGVHCDCLKRSSCGSIEGFCSISSASIFSSLISTSVGSFGAAFVLFFFLDLDFGFGALFTGGGGGVSFFGSSGGGTVMPKRFNRIFSSHSSMPCRWRFKFRC